MTYSSDPSTEQVPTPDEPFNWHRALAPDELPAGRVTAVTIGHRSLCMTNVGGTYGAMEITARTRAAR